MALITFLRDISELMDSLFFRVEIAVKQILCGLDIKIGASVANKECLDWYREWAEKN